MMSTRSVTMVTAIQRSPNCSHRATPTLYRLEGGAKSSSDPSFETETISVHGAVFTANTTDCRLSERGCDCTCSLICLTARLILLYIVGRALDK